MNDADFHRELQECDYLIAGASFAGSLLAAKLAQKGKVVLLDRAIPGSRLKCAGGVDLAEYEKLQIDIPNLPIKRAVMHIKGREYPFACNYTVTDRRELDRAVWHQAREAGASFHQAKYLAHDVRHKTVRLNHDGHDHEATYHNFILAAGWKYAPRRDPHTFAVAEIVEGTSPFPDTLYLEIPDRALIGYYWIFPMPGGRTNVGGGTISGNPFSFAMIEDFKRRMGINGRSLGKGGGAIPLRPAPVVQANGCTLFGDSAGMVFGLNGEGLGYISKMAEVWAEGLAGQQDLNRIWASSRTFSKLNRASQIMRFINGFEGKSGIRIFPALNVLGALIKQWKYPI